MDIYSEVVDWLHGRPDWLQEAAMRILMNGTLSAVDYNELTALCKTEAGQNKNNSRIFPGLTSHSASIDELRLVSIGNIHGIENLAPRKPLAFGNGNLTVIYGNNGSGKSGYTRILKKACGKAHAVELRPNVFDASPSKRSCTICFKLGGKSQAFEWQPFDKHVPELSVVDIFDTECGKFYLKENEASYIPKIIALFDSLVKVCELIKKNLQIESDQLPSKLPLLPTSYAGTQIASIYTNLKATQTATDLEAILVFTDADKQALKNLEERLKTDDPHKLAIQKRAKKVQLDSLIQKTINAIDKLSIKACEHVLNLKSDASEKRIIASEAAKAISASATLNGIGSKTWRALWEAAKQFSNTEAYQDHYYPYTEEGAKCVLCHQVLDVVAQQRLKDFDIFVKGEIEQAAKLAESVREESINALPSILTEVELITMCQAGGLESELWLPRFKEVWETIDKLVSELKTSPELTIKGLATQNYPWFNDLQCLSNSLEEQAKQHDADAVTFDRAKALKQRDELLAQQWTSQQSEAINAELKRLKQIEQLNKWVASTNHTAISKQAGIVAEKVITDAYIERFTNELRLLGAQKIKVELVKTRITKGKAMHSVRLKGLKTDGITPTDVLSEGERRIVELAAFLADVTGRASNAPFIFDDPISSLDQTYEEKTIDRLISLSSDRQVLVFTHRLSFLGILNDKASPDMVCIRHELWGAGEPGDIPLFGKNPEGALKVLRDERLKQAEKALNKDGSEAYYPLAKAICSDLRILMERIVELVFLADVIQRHRRDVHTKNKVVNLAKITSDDCLLVDEFMTKYSCYEHSQSVEAPIDVPTPDELNKDITRLLTWHSEFKARS